MWLASKFLSSKPSLLRPLKPRASPLPARFKSSNTRAKRSSSAKKQFHQPSIYEKIKELVGADTPTDLSSKVSITNETNLVSNENKHCSSVVRQNTQEKETEQVRVENSSSEDVSPIVHKITQAVRSETPVVRMEEQLEELGLLFSPEIVEKVLKRCFKVGHLALRFFNWVTLQPGFHHTTETYNAMIYIAGEARELDLMVKLVGEMDGESCAKNVKTWTILISHYGKAGRIGKALWTFEAMKKSGLDPDKGVYEVLLRTLCNAGKAELALEFYKEMVFKNIAVEFSLYELLLDCLARSGDTGALRLVEDDMVKIAQISQSEVYTRMLKSFCISEQIEKAQELFEEMKKKNLNLDAQVYEVLVKGLCRVGKMLDAIELVDNMKQHSAINNKIFGCLIDGYLRKGDALKAIDLLHGMIKLGCLPTISCYTQVIQHLFRSDQYEKACEIYIEMMKNGIEPDIVAMTAMVAGHVYHGKISEAWVIFEDMQRKGIKPTWKAYSIFIKELCKASKPEEAIKVLNEMSKSAINATDDIFRLVISSLNRKGELDKSGTVEKMRSFFKLHRHEDKPICQTADCQSICEEQEVSRDSMNQDIDSTSIEIEYSDTDLEEVCRLLSSSTNWSVTQEALENNRINFTPELVERILRDCQRHGHAALRFFSWIGKQIGYAHTTETYNIAIKIAGSAKDFQHMRDLYHEMKRRGCSITPNTWTIMIAQYGQAGLTEIAIKTFKEMKCDGYQPDHSTYKYLMIFLCGKKGRKVDEAIKVFQEMINAGFMPDKEMLEIYLSSLCEDGVVEDAKKCVRMLCKRGMTSQLAYSLLIRSLCRAGRVNEALSLVDEMDRLGCTMDQYIYGSVVHALLRRGRLDEALDKVEAMKRAGISHSVHIRTSLIVHFCREKQIGKAMEIFRKIREDGCEPTVVTYSALIRGFMNEGMFTEAWNIFHRMKLKGPFPDFETYSMFITCLCKAGRSEESLQLIHEMLECGVIPSAVNFRTVFHGLNSEGKQNLARSALQTKWLMNRRRKFSI